MGVYLFHVLVIFLLRKFAECGPLGLSSAIIFSCLIVLVIASSSHFIKTSFESLLKYHYYQ